MKPIACRFATALGMAVAVTASLGAQNITSKDLVDGILYVTGALNHAWAIEGR